MSLLIDINKLISSTYEHSRIMEKIYPNPVTNNRLAVVIKTTNQCYDNLTDLKGEKNRIKYLNSRKFLNSMSDFTYITFNDTFIELKPDSINFLDIVIENTIRYLPNTLTLIMQTDEPKIRDILKKLDFVFNTATNYMQRVNNLKLNIPVGRSLKNQTSTIKSKNESLGCRFKYRFSDETIQFIKDMSHRGSTVNKNMSITQKEMSGSMYTSNVDRDDVNIIDLDIASMSKGDSEKTSTYPKQITFHTHPVEAYDRNDVKNGWPSKKDYLTVLRAYDMFNLILHVVISVEGMYLISINKEWLNTKIPVDSVMYLMDTLLSENNAMSKKTSRTPESHCEEITKIKVYNTRLLNVQFISWDNASDIFTVHHGKNTVDMCTIPT